MILLPNKPLFLFEENHQATTHVSNKLFHQNIRGEALSKEMNVPGASHGTRISVSRNNFDMFRVSVQNSLKN